MFRRIFRAAAPLAAAAFMMGSVGVAQATEGLFQHGYGARHKALGGAGVADSRDATAVALNPAGLVHVSDQFNAAISVFSPHRKFEGAAFPPFNPGFTPQGTVDSDWTHFYIPNMARSWRVDSPLIDVFALSMYGNGGMNTHYPNVPRGPTECFAGPGGPPIVTRTGIFCAGPLDINYTQAFMSAAVAKQFGKVSVGIAPIFALAQIEIHGVTAFTGISNDPANLSNQGLDTAYGGGVRAGVEIEVMPNIRIGLAGNSRIYMTEHDKYRGMLAEQGDLDIPATVQAGIAVDVKPNITAMVDWRHIFYSDVAAINNSSAIASAAQASVIAGAPNTAIFLGADNGTGFGWQDIDIFKVGVEWRANDKWTWRAGYAHSENPIKSRDVMFNILAPGVIADEYTGGVKYKWSDSLDLELTGMYAAENSVRGVELATVANPTHAIEISMYQWEITGGITWKFGAPPPAEPMK